MKKIQELQRMVIAIACLLLPVSVCAQKLGDDYCSFISFGKNWHVLEFPEIMFELPEFEYFTPYEHDYYFDFDYATRPDTVINSKEYYALYHKIGLDADVMPRVCGYYREQDGKVYKLQNDGKGEYLMCDFTVNEGDEFEVSPAYINELFLPNTKALCKVTKVDAVSTYWGEKLKRIFLDVTWYEFDENGDVWNESTERAVWIEGIGNIERPDISCQPMWCGNYITTSYIYDYNGFTYSNSLKLLHYYGCSFSIGKEKEERFPEEFDTPEEYEQWWESYWGHDDLQFEFIADTLHITGYLWTSCGGGLYMHCYQTAKDEIRYKVDEYGILTSCAGAHEVDLKFPGFKEGEYTIFDRNGVEHKVICGKKPEIAKSETIWSIGSQWDVLYADSLVSYRIDPGFEYKGNWYMTLLHKVENKVDTLGFVRNEGDTLIYVRSYADGVIGDECLLYDFRKCYEYGDTLYYGVNGRVESCYIDWNDDAINYYISSDSPQQCLPAWNGVIYQYGCVAGPLEMFYGRFDPSTNARPKATNISHVIFSTKKNKRDTDGMGDPDDIVIPYTLMLSDGKVWECVAVSDDNISDSIRYRMEVAGDVMIAGRNCKRVNLASESHPELNCQLTAFEEGRKLYGINANGEPYVILDFGVNKDDRIYSNQSVLAVDTIMLQGTDYRRISIDTPYEYTLIEGIGINKDTHLPASILGKEGWHSELLSCWDNGVLVLSSQDLGTNLPTIGINSTYIPTNSNTPMYDIFGRKVSRTLNKGIYIKGGKKYVITY